MNCTNKQQETCDVEKRGCNGCAYNESNTEIVYAIKNKDGLYATYGASEFKEGLRFARIYKSKETALRHYFSRKGEYHNLSVVKVKIEVLGEQKVKPEEFKEYKN